MPIKITVAAFEIPTGFAAIFRDMADDLDFAHEKGASTRVLLMDAGCFATLKAAIATARMSEVSAYSEKEALEKAKETPASGYAWTDETVPTL